LEGGHFVYLWEEKVEGIEKATFASRAEQKQTVNFLRDEGNCLAITFTSFPISLWLEKFPQERGLRSKVLILHINEACLSIEAALL
jgi:hypothetical protein